jgi:hypothetical protein
MRDLATRSAARLDRMEALAPGAGRLDFHGLLRGNRDAGLGGLGVSLERRWSNTSAYLDGYGGYGWGDLAGWQVGVEGGIRMRF